MKCDSNNTRRFPRTTNEAFPGSTEYACAIEVHSSKRKEVIAVRCLLVAVGILAVASVFA